MDPEHRQPEPQTPIRKRRNVFKMTAIVAFIVLLGLSTAGWAIQQNQAKQLRQTKDEAVKLEKRVSSLEADASYPQQQVTKDEYQAIFLTNGQVYFGKVTHVTKDTMKLEDIFYLNEGSPATSDNPSITKLGDEMHKPEDEMMIERKNITFWENLKNDGQVAKAIAEYKKTH